MNKTPRKPTKCVRCGFPISSHVRYCPDCRWDQTQAVKPNPSPLKQGLVAAFLGVCLWFVILRIYDLYAVKHEQLIREGASAPSSDENALRDIPLAAVNSGIEMANNLLARLRDNPQDVEALSKMANLSYDRQVFSRAVDFYRRYLALKPEDLNARIKYAIALGSAGNSDEAIAEYQDIIAKEPDNIAAYIELAALFAKLDKKTQAAAVLAEAQARAKKPEDLARLERVAKALEEGQLESAATRASGGRESAESGFDRLINLVWSDPAVGRNLAKSGIDPRSGTLFFYLRDAKTALTPQNRDALVERIKRAARSEKNGAPRRIAFVDATSGEEVERISLQ